MRHASSIPIKGEIRDLVDVRWYKSELHPELSLTKINATYHEYPLNIVMYFLAHFDEC